MAGVFYLVLMLLNIFSPYLWEGKKLTPSLFLYMPSGPKRERSHSGKRPRRPEALLGSEAPDSRPAVLPGPWSLPLCSIHCTTAPLRGWGGRISDKLPQVGFPMPVRMVSMRVCQSPREGGHLKGQKERRSLRLLLRLLLNKRTDALSRQGHRSPEGPLVLGPAAHTALRDAGYAEPPGTPPGMMPPALTTLSAFCHLPQTLPQPRWNRDTCSVTEPPQGAKSQNASHRNSTVNTIPSG